MEKVVLRSIVGISNALTPLIYAYKLDTTTPGGKTIWSTILAKMAAKKRITLGFPSVGSNANLQTLNYIGRHAHGSNE